jgi:hypothetical protein
LLQIGCSILFLNGELVLSRDALGFFSRPHTAPDHACAAKKLSNVHVDLRSAT